jgi:hypothetical protein
MSDEHQHGHGGGHGAQGATPETLAGFREQVAVVAARLFEAREIDQSRYQDVLCHAGITAVPEYEGRKASVTLADADRHAPPRGGFKREQLTEETRQELDAEALKALRVTIWTYLKRADVGGYLQKTDVGKVLDELGYQQQRPSFRTHVSFYKANGRFDSYGEPQYAGVTYVLQGEHDPDEIKAKITEAAGKPAEQEFVLGLFPEARSVSGGHSQVKSVTVTVKRDWPESYGA